MSESIEWVMCIVCDRLAAVGRDGHYRCGCGGWGSADGMPRRHPPTLDDFNAMADPAAGARRLAHDHGSAWDHDTVEALLHRLARIAHAVERVADRLDAIARFQVTVTSHRKDSAMPITQPPIPFNTDTGFNLTINVVPLDALGNARPDTLTWSTSDPAVATVSPGTDTLTADATILAAGSVTLTFTDPAGNSGAVAVGVAEAVAGFNVTVTQNPK